MNWLMNFISAPKAQQGPPKTTAQSVKETKMSIEESIRRYEQLCAK